MCGVQVLALRALGLHDSSNVRTRIRRGILKAAAIPRALTNIRAASRRHGRGLCTRQAMVRVDWGGRMMLQEPHALQPFPHAAGHALPQVEPDQPALQKIAGSLQFAAS